MKKYNKYKPSGINWIGDIPEHWELVRLKFLCSVTTGDKNTVDRNDNADYPFFVRSQHVEKISTYSYDGEAILTAGDGVGVAKVFHYINGKFDFHQRVYKFSDFHKVLGKYFFYYMRENLYKEVLKFNAKSTVDSLRLPFLQNFLISFGNIKEQTQIANYLDQKTSQTDQTIIQKEKLIELYEEEKKAMINQAVTKGLNKNVKLKPSGIDRLGNIPEHWELRRLASIGEFSKGSNISKKDLTETGLPAILYDDLYTKYDIKADKIINFISDETASNSKLIKKGDLLFTGSGETREDIGKCIVYVGNEKTYAGGDLIIFKQDKFNSLFLSYSLNCSFSIYQKTISAKGDIIVHIYASKLREIYLPIPPKKEQSEIVRHIEEQSERINNAITKAKKEIKLIKEYRQALIFEAVTGKIDVRETVKAYAF